MRHITISILSVFVVLPTVASARMPAVSLTSGGVSARSAFGEDITPVKKTAVATTTRTNTAPTRTRAVVARASTPVASDTGAQIIASSDVLAPRRPSDDLWARSGTDTALRMPSPSEFSVIRSDGALPEESLDNTFASSRPAATSQNAVADDDVAQLAQLDAQISRLVEMQRRAEESIRPVSSRVISAPIASASSAPSPATSASVAPVAPIASVAPVVSEPVTIASATSANDAPVSLRRLVVPSDNDDVIIRSVEKNTSPRIAAVRDDFSKMSPAQLRQAFRKTFLSENKHLSTFSVDDAFDVASDMSSAVEGFTASRDLSEVGGIRPLEIKIKFRDEDSALSRENYNLLTEYASIVVSKPTRAIQVAIPQSSTTSKDARKLAARRLAIIEQVLTDNGVSQQRIVPVLASRNDGGFVLRVISSEQYETLTQQKRDIFGDTVGKKTYKSMSW